MRALGVLAVLILLAVTAAPAGAAQPIVPLDAQARLSNAGADGDAATDAFDPDVAYNPQRDEFLLVFEQSTATPQFGIEIFGRRLDAAGRPIGDAFQISGLTDAPNFDASDPAVAYDPERQRYGVAFVRDDTVDGNTEAFLQLVGAEGGIIRFDGTPGVEAVRASSIGGASERYAADTDIAYRPDASGDASPGDAFLITVTGDEDGPGLADIFVNARNPATGAIIGGSNVDVSDMGTGAASRASLVVIPGTEAIAVAWTGYTTCCDFEIFARRLEGSLPDCNNACSGQKAITVTGDVNLPATDPSLTANPSQNELLVAYVARPTLAEGSEIFVQRLSVALDEVGTDDQQVSSAGPAGSANSFFASSPVAVFNPPLQRYLVTWTGTDDGRPGYDDDERERSGTVLDTAGAELIPQDFVISRAGAQGDDGATPNEGGLAVNPTTGRWLSVWGTDDGQAPLVDNEFEIWGRTIGEDFDVDDDGSAVNGGDCDDANPAVNPAATDVAGNGVDENCDGADAVVPPVATPSPTLTAAALQRRWKVKRRYTRATRLRVRNVKAGMTVSLKCTGKGCPKKLKAGRRFAVKRDGTLDLLRSLRRAKLRPRAKVEVRILEAGRIGRVITLTIRRRKQPRVTERCLPPGATVPVACAR